MNLLCAGISHHTAPLDVRERLWFSSEEIRRTLPLLKPLGVGESVMFSTCNRTELYSLTEQSSIPSDEIKKILISQKSADGNVQESDLFTLTGGDAARHLFRVASGIDSMVLGDVQILAQVKEGFHLATELGTAGFFMNRLFQLAFRAGKRSRTETEIGDGAVSVSYAAVELAEKIFDDMQKKTALVIGAGETADLTATHLRGKDIGRLFITNRTQSRAEELAAKVQGEVVPFDRWTDIVHDVDIIISSVEVNRFILTAPDIERLLDRHGSKTLFIIDIGVPRNIDPDVKNFENVFLYDLDTLNLMVEENLQKRRAEIPKVESVITEVLAELTHWYSSLEVNPTITALTQFMENIRQEELAKNINRFDPKDRELAELVTKRIINKIIHAPIVNLRTEPEASLSDRLQKMSAIQKLFGLSRTSKDGSDV
ncbi:MAG: glutamyl-tRNA reductase [Ignavibacteriae bacterium]|nr:MAG: glutamyl-tRNA reductase [Ignavibacteriota bacterium]